MPMGVFIPARISIGTCVCVYTRRGFLLCLFEYIGFLRTSDDGYAIKRNPRFYAL